jgi:uncharacterized protein (TIGR02453 family)
MAKAKASPAAAFDGFTPGVFDFFAALAEHQARDWFQANKATYEAEVLGPMAALIGSLSLAFAARDIPLTGDAKRSVFRINRDVRFSNDKRPYKTNAGAVLSRDGTKAAGKGVLYIHIDGTARAAFAAIGFYRPGPGDLAAIRRAIADKPERWLETEAKLAAAGLALSREDALTRMPKGFEDRAGTDIADGLRSRNFIVRRPVATERLFGAGLIDDIAAFAADGLPLLAFGWRASGTLIA